MKKSIVITMYNRPEYSKAILRALSECIGINEYRLIICVEPVNKEVIKVAQSVDFAESQVIVNTSVLGCSRNTYEAIRRGFDISDFVIYVQDDDQLAPDALRYFEYAAERCRDDPSVYTVCAWNLMKEPCPESHYYRIVKRQIFISLTMATWKDRWAEPGGMRDNWSFADDWDVHINERLRKARFEVFPWLSRAQNIGESGGVHCPSTEWHRRTIRCDFWASDPRVVDTVRKNADRVKELFVVE